MPKRTDNLAKPGDKLYRIVCCDGARLVRESQADRWTCGKCYGSGQIAGLFTYTKEMELVELSLKESRSFRD